jgi:Cu/Ag efflux protein CusF
MKKIVPLLGLALALAGAARADEMAVAEVRKVDKDAGKLTLKHGEIKNLDMPPMTMVFIVRDKTMLERVKAGDKVRFKAVKDGGSYVVTEIQSAP